MLAIRNDNEPEKTDDADLTERVLLSLVIDVSLLHETVERIKVQVIALAIRRGIEPAS